MGHLIRRWSWTASFGIFCAALVTSVGCVTLESEEERVRKSAGDLEEVLEDFRRRESTQMELPDSSVGLEPVGGANGPIQPVNHLANIGEAVNGVVDEIAREPTLGSPNIQFATPASSFRAASSWTLEELERKALQNNPAIAELEAQIAAAEGRHQQAGLPPNTRLGYSGQQVFSSGQAEQHGLLLEQKFIRGDKLLLDQAVIAHEISMAEQRWFAQQQRVTTDVRLEFYRVLIAQRRVETAQELVSISQAGVETANALLLAQDVSQVDVMRAQVELHSAEIQRDTSEQILDSAWNRLAVVVGEPNLEHVPLMGSLEEEVSTLAVKESLVRLLEQSPELTIAFANVERSRAKINRELAEIVPDVDVQAVIQSDNGTGSANANLQVVFPLPLRNRNEGAIRAAQAELVAASHAIDRISSSLEYRLTAAYERFEAARIQVEAYTKADGLLEQSKRALDLVQTGYEERIFTNVELLVAQRVVSQAEMDYLDAVSQMWLSFVEIEGLLLKDGFDVKM